MFRVMCRISPELLLGGQGQGSSVRSLYSASSLGIDGYLQSKKRVKDTFGQADEKFRAKMTEFTASGAKQMIFSEDLKNMLHLAEDNSQDKELLLGMIQKFANENKDLRFGSYVFGPVVMRYFYTIGDADTALKLFKDKSLESFFTQWSSYQILLDLLYNKKRYQDVLDTYELIKAQNQQGGAHARHVTVIVFGACYKLNTEASYKYAMNLWKELLESGNQPMRKTATFAAGLALAQNAPHAALEILYATVQPNYITVRNLKVLAMLELGRIDDTLPILRSILIPASPQSNKSHFCLEVLDKCREVVEKSDNSDLKLEFQRLEKALKEHDHVTDQTIDKLICSEIESRPSQTFPKNQTALNTSFGRTPRRPTKPQRPGLAELF